MEAVLIASVSRIATLRIPIVLSLDASRDHLRTKTDYCSIWVAVVLTSSDSGAVKYRNGNTCMFVGTLWKSVADVSKDGWQNLAIALKTPVLGSVSAIEISRKLRTAGANLWLAAFA